MTQFLNTFLSGICIAWVGGVAYLCFSHRKSGIPIAVMSALLCIGGGIIIAGYHQLKADVYSEMHTYDFVTYNADSLFRAGERRIVDSVNIHNLADYEYHYDKFKWASGLGILGVVIFMAIAVSTKLFESENVAKGDKNDDGKNGNDKPN